MGARTDEPGGGSDAQHVVTSSRDLSRRRARRCATSGISARGGVQPWRRTRAPIAPRAPGR
jgi:hypothetical protein